MKRRSFLASMLGLPSIAAADFCLPPSPLNAAETKPDKRPRAVVFSADWCGPCKTLKNRVEQGDWPEFNWTFAEKGKPEFEEERKVYGRPIAVYPTLWFPTVYGPKGYWYHIEGYDPKLIDVVVSHIGKYPKADEKSEREEQDDAYYPTRGRLWTFPGTTRKELLRHMISNANHSGRFSTSWMSRLDFTELSSLHSDHHQGRVKSQAVRMYRQAVRRG